MFEDVVSSLTLSVGTESCFTLEGYGLTHSNQARLERLARDQPLAFYEHL